MYCTFCGKQISNDALFCRYCGKPTHQSDAFVGLVDAARMGDQDAVSVLYEKTYSKVYYTVKSMIKDEDSALDIIQDTYIKAFAHLDSFQGDVKFLPWVRQIAANTARDWLKKKRPLLFTELSSDDGQDASVEELLPDERSESLPDQVIDQKETKRLIREIIEELPEDQRAAIGMFYYEEMSVKEIAAAMGVSESAVKSRLMYGRNKIEKKVLELEKQGTKLYSLSPLPFLLLLFRNLETYATQVPDTRILHAILALQPMDAAAAAGAAQGAGGAAQGAGTAGAGAGCAGIAGAGAGGTAQGAGTAGAAAGGLGALKIGLIALSVMVAAGLGTFGAIQIASHFAETQEPPAIEDSVDREETENQEEREEPEDLEEGEAREESEEPEESAPIDEALEQYRIIISQADSYEYNEAIPDLETVGYRYALVQMQLDDPVPTLLVEKEEGGWTSAVNIRVFQYDPHTKTVRQPAEAIAGGIRGGLSMAGDGNGMMSTEWSGGTGEGSVTRITLDGDFLNREVCWKGRIDLLPDSITFIEIEWHETGDLSALEDWTMPEAGETSSSEPVENGTLPIDGERIVLTGTVGTYNYDEIIALQGQPDPNASDYDESTLEYYQSMTYRVIVLDMPQTLRIRPGGWEGDPDEYSSHEALMINIGYAEGMDQYEGRHITFSIDPDSTHWPSDTSLPLGQPFTGDIRVLD